MQSMTGSRPFTTVGACCWLRCGRASHRLAVTAMAGFSSHVCVRLRLPWDLENNLRPIERNHPNGPTEHLLDRLQPIALVI